MQLSDIPLLRLQSQRIAQADFERPENVVRHLLAMQSQDYPGALWAISLRTYASTQADVEQAVLNKKIVRTWPMRGTLHFMHADDARWMVRLLASRATVAAKGRRLSLGLSDTVMADVESVIRTALINGTVMRRDVLKELLARKINGVRVESEQFGHILRNFGEQGILCFGPHDGKQPTFVLMDDWLPASREMERDEALQELAQRYFISHGPASLRDFTGWSGLTMTDSRKALESALPRLEAIVVLDTTYYMQPGIKPLVDSSAFLLPGFDEYMLGYKDRSATLALEHSSKIVPGNNGMFLATMISDGQVTGTWKKQVKSKGLVIEYQSFLANANSSVYRQAAEKYAAFLGTKLYFV